MTDWKAHALDALDQARQDIATATEPTLIIVCAIGQTDLLRERPLTVYTNQSWRWMRQMLAYAVWRLSIRAEEELEASSTPSNAGGGNG